jgi:hypothetical protein
MRFMTIYKTRETNAPPTPEHMAAMGAFIDELTKAGILIMTDGLQASAKGARVRQSEGKVTVIDGPFTETKELIAGFAIVNVKSKDEAIALTKRFLAIAGDGESEIRQMYEPSDFDPEHAKVAEQQRARMAANR